MMQLEELNDMQREAAVYVDGPLLILAGAGSGKTKTITHRIAYLIGEENVNPYNIMAITFTNKAAGEMRERIDKIVGFGSESIWVMTFHATCVRILRRFIDQIGYDRNFTIYDTDDSKSVMKAVFKKLQIDPKQYKEAAVLREISNAKNELLGPDDYALQNASDFGRKRYVDAYREYQETLRRSNALDFDDLIRLTVYLLKACPEVLENYQHRFRYIMVDEYQDTNTAQFMLIKLLADAHKNLCVVGDDDQSIYKFRGANIKNILNFEKNYPDAKVIKLEQNYRSTQNILNAANAVISNNTGRKPKKLWTAREDDTPVRFRVYDTGREEAEEIVDEITRMKRRGEYEYGDCAILYRTNAQSRAFEEAFVYQSIPYHIVGGVNFYARKEIKDVMAYLKTIDNAKDDLAVRRIINIPKRGIGAASITKVQEYADSRGIGFFDACMEADQIPTLGRAADKIKNFSLMIRVFRTRLEDCGILELTQKLLEDTGYIEEIQASDEEDAEDRIANIDELLTKIRLYEEENPEGTLSGFLEEVALVSDLDAVDEGDSRVLLMTVHSAKGLEFPVVFLSGMEDGVFPSYMTINSGNEEDIEEERRLAYVAITRAKDVLMISSARARMVRGETQYNAISRFVREIPQEYLKGEVPVQRVRWDEVPPQNSRARDFFRENPYHANQTDPGRAYPRNMGSERINASRAYSGNPGSGMVSETGAYHGKKSAPKKIALSKGSEMTGEKPDYQVGDRVVHIKFGEGTVTAMQQTPRDVQVTVVFDSVGQKIMYAMFAKLKKI